VLEDLDMKRIPETFASAIRDVVNALQVAVLLAAELDSRGAKHSMSVGLDPDRAALRRAINQAAAALATLKPPGPGARVARSVSPLSG
jgi:hypothetical protein